MVSKRIKFIILLVAILNFLNPYNALAVCYFDPDTTSLATTNVSHYLMDEESGNRADAQDSNTLTDNNTVTFAAGKVGNAADFDGSTEYFSVADNTVFDVTTGDFSIAFWFASADEATGARLFWKRVTATGQGYYAQLNASDQIYFSPADEGGTDYVEVTGSTDIATGTTNFFHVVITWTNPDTAKIYVNGVDETTVNTADSLGSITNASVFQIARDGSGVAYNGGLFDEFGFWNVALSQAQVTELYNAGAGNTCGATPPAVAVPPPVQSIYY